MRKYSPASYMPRITQADYRVPDSNIVIEKGTTVIVPVHAIHNDPEYYPEPEKFNPDRFKIEEMKKRDSMTWLGFGGGPRGWYVCAELAELNNIEKKIVSTFFHVHRNSIGTRFGMLQIRVGLITILRNFHFSLGSNHDETIPIPINKKVFLLTPESVYLKLIPLK